MCSHYQGLKEQARYQKHFGVMPPPEPGKADLWPGYLGSFIRRPPQAALDGEAKPALQALNGLFGLVPHWSTDTKITKHTYNARVETVATKPSFRDAWRLGQRCIIPAEHFFEPDWRSGKAVPTCIGRADGSPMGLAGLWSSWKSDKGELVFSYTMLTINADEHPLMKQFHKPTDEKRMVVILPPERYLDWLAIQCQPMDFMQPYPADLLQASAPHPANGVFFQ